MSWDRSSDPTDAARLDAALRGGHCDPTHGDQSLHESFGDAPGPDAAACPHCGINARTLPDAIASEEWRRAMAVFFADDPEDRVKVALRVYAYARRVHPAACVMVDPDFGDRIGAFILIHPELRWDEGSLPAGVCEFCGVNAAGIEAEVKERVRRRLVEYLVNGNSADVDACLVRTYAIAKALCPELLRGQDGKDMSLERLGDVFGEPNRQAARARWSGRIKRIFNVPVEQAGGVAHAHFQKSATTCDKYRAAQVGNHNRSGGKKNHVDRTVHRPSGSAPVQPQAQA